VYLPSVHTVYAKPRRSQYNVRQDLYATGRNYEFTCHNAINALYSMMRRVSHDRSDCLRYKQRFA